MTTFLCNKIAYPTEKEAKFKLRYITNKEQENKKPVRCYECEVCGQWHLTSIPHENWKQIKQKVS